MAFQPAFRPAFQPAFRAAFGASGAGETPLQQAVIAAWDMQEESGPLLPAKGDIEIPALNSPGFTADGPASGIGARTFDAAISQYFARNDSDGTFGLVSQKTIRWWEYVTGGNVRAAALGRSAEGGEQYRIRRDSGVAALSHVVWPGAAVNSFGSGAGSVWVRREISIDSGTFTDRAMVMGGSSFTQTLSITPAAVNTGAVAVIGSARTGPDDMTGRICLLAIFDRILTAEERTFDETPRLASQL